MRTTIRLAPVLLAAIALAGCGSSTDPVPANGTTSAAPDDITTVEIEDETVVLDVEPAGGESSPEEAVPTGPRPSVWAELIMAPLNQMMADSGTMMQQSMGQIMSGRRPSADDESKPDAPVELPNDDEASADEPGQDQTTEPASDDEPAPSTPDEPSGEGTP